MFIFGDVLINIDMNSSVNLEPMEVEVCLRERRRIAVHIICGYAIQFYQIRNAYD